MSLPHPKQPSLIPAWESSQVGLTSFAIIVSFDIEGFDARTYRLRHIFTDDQGLPLSTLIESMHAEMSMYLQLEQELSSIIAQAHIEFLLP